MKLRKQLELSYCPQHPLDCVSHDAQLLACVSHVARLLDFVSHGARLLVSHDARLLDCFSHDSWLLEATEVQHQVANLVAFPSHLLPWKPVLQRERQLKVHHGILNTHINTQDRRAQCV